MTITKSLLLVVGAVAQWHAVTPPNARPPTEQLREQRGIERIIPRLPALVKPLVCLWTLLEASVLVAHSDASPPALACPLRHLLPASLASPHLSSPTPFFLTGILLALFGAILRAHCYHALGTRFTFELAIRPTHALVTHGVYSVVRHPSYTGALALALGWVSCLHDPRGVFVAVVAGAFGIQTRSRSSEGDTISMMSMDGDAIVTSVLACAWMTAFGLLCVGLSARIHKEDAMLEQNFGEAWRAWAKKVPYRLVPGVY